MTLSPTYLEYINLKICSRGYVLKSTSGESFSWYLIYDTSKTIHSANWVLIKIYCTYMLLMWYFLNYSNAFLKLAYFLKWEIAEAFLKTHGRKVTNARKNFSPFIYFLWIVMLSDSPWSIHTHTHTHTQEAIWLFDSKAIDIWETHIHIQKVIAKISLCFAVDHQSGSSEFHTV